MLGRTYDTFLHYERAYAKMNFFFGESGPEAPDVPAAQKQLDFPRERSPRIFPANFPREFSPRNFPANFPRESRGVLKM
jgi:hypothetical protein